MKQLGFPGSLSPRMTPMFLMAGLLMGLFGCSKDPSGPEPPPQVAPPKIYTYSVVNEYPHQTNAFTQGLVFHTDDYLYEGTGQFGESTLRRVDLTTGTVVTTRAIPAKPGSGDYFGEGISILGNRIFQLTWISQVGFIYDLSSFDSISQFTYPTQGWGLTNDGARFIMSDGTSTLYFRDTLTFALLGTVQVVDTSGPVGNLNELELINGEVWANVWLTNRIARINPASGVITGYIDLSGLLSPPSGDVLNGIAYDSVGDRIFVTGKYWPKLFEIELQEVE